LLALALFAGACGSGGDDDDNGGGGDDAKGKITVGSDSFPEAQIVGEMYAQVLENAGFDVGRKLDIQSREVRLPAMESGEIDVAPEYVASLLSVIDPEADLVGSADEVRERLTGPLAEMELEILDHSSAIDTNAFAVTQETAEELDLQAVSDLEDVAGDLVLGAPAECPDRPFCIPGLKDVYNVEFGDFKSLEYGAATVQALNAGAIDVALIFSTDPLVGDNDLVVLEDDRNLQSADNIVPLARQEISDEAKDLLNEVSAALSTEEITDLNARVAIEQEDAADVAREFLEGKGLL
jgi:osmoprotectant transport system substrate-binding protein